MNQKDANYSFAGGNSVLCASTRLSLITAPTMVDMTPLNIVIAPETVTARIGVMLKYSSMKSFCHTVIPPLNPVKNALPNTIRIYRRIVISVFICFPRLSFYGSSKSFSSTSSSR